MKYKFSLKIVAATCVAATMLAQTSIAFASQPLTAPEIEKSFSIALGEIRSGAFSDAVIRLRAILNQNPSLNRVRLELARALFFAGDLKKSRIQFLTALSAPHLPDVVKANILEFIRAIDTRRGFTSSISFGIKRPNGGGRSYDTNKVKLDLFGTGVPLEFTLNRTPPPTVSFVTEANAQQLWPISQSRNGTSRSLYLRGHAKLSDAPGTAFDNYQVDITPGLQVTGKNSTASIGLLQSFLQTDGQQREYQSGVDLTLSGQTRQGWSAALDLTKSYARSWTNSAASGALFQASLTVQKTVGGYGAYTAVINYERKASRRSDYSYNYTKLKLARQIYLHGGLSLTASIFGDVFFPIGKTPGFVQKNNSREYGTSVSITDANLAVLNRYAPYATIGYTRHLSDIAAYSYHGIQAELGIQSLF